MRSHWWGVSKSLVSPTTLASSFCPTCSGCPRGPPCTVLNPPVVVLGPIRVTEVAEVVVSTQMLEQLVIVQIAFITELAEWVPTMRRVIWVPLHAVPCQVLARVPLALICEDLWGMGNWAQGSGSRASHPLPWPDSGESPWTPGAWQAHIVTGRPSLSRLYAA